MSLAFSGFVSRDPTTIYSKTPALHLLSAQSFRGSSGLRLESAAKLRAMQGEGGATRKWKP